MRVTNTSGAESVTLNALSDNIHGNLKDQGSCLLPQPIAAGAFYECQFTAIVIGDSGDSETDTITATVEDDDGNVVIGQDGATVAIGDIIFIDGFESGDTSGL